MHKKYSISCIVFNHFQVPGEEIPNLIKIRSLHLLIFNTVTKTKTIDKWASEEV